MKRLRCGSLAVVVAVLFSASADALGPFEPDLQIQSMSAPASAVAGAEIQVAESDESNNVAVRAIQVTAAPPGPTTPPSVPAGPGTMVAPPRDLRTDLAVESMTPSATSALPGERVTVQARVANRGNVTTVASSASLLLRPRIGSAQVLQTVSVPRLSGGATHGLFFSSGLAAALAPGTYTVAVKVDSDNAFAETDEGNNEATVEFTVAGPDLAGCGSLRVTPGSVRPGGVIAISACIHNIGTAESPTAPYRIVLSASRTLDSPRVLRQSAGGTPLGVRTTLNINLNGVTVPADLTPATYYLGVLIDPDSRVAETNERNNTIGPLALVITP